MAVRLHQRLARNGGLPTLRGRNPASPLVVWHREPEPSKGAAQPPVFTMSTHLNSCPKQRRSHCHVQLGIDAQNVMTLRMMRLASGGTRAQNEMTRLVVEKGTAAAEAQVAAVGAAVAGNKDHVIAGKALNVIRKRVGANRRRLSRR